MPFWDPRGAPRGAKKCTFFWVFNNSPSRDKILGQFLGPPGHPVWGPSQGYPNGPPDRPYGWVPQLGMGGVTLPHPPKWGPKPTIETAKALRNWARSFVASETVETLQSWASSWVTCVAAMLDVAKGRCVATGPIARPYAIWGVRAASEEQLPQSKWRKPCAVGLGHERRGRLREPNAARAGVSVLRPT